MKRLKGISKSSQDLHSTLIHSRSDVELTVSYESLTRSVAVGVDPDISEAASHTKHLLGSPEAR